MPHIFLKLCGAAALKIKSTCWFYFAEIKPHVKNTQPDNQQQDDLLESNQAIQKYTQRSGKILFFEQK
jgi:hypothetical protein